MYNVKKVSLDALPAEAWRVIQGDAITRAGELSPDEMVAQQPYLYRAVNLVSDAVAAVPVVAERNGDEIDPAGMVGFDNMANLLTRIVGSLQVHGQAFVFIERNRARVLGLQYLSPTSVKPKFTSEGVSHYDRTLPGRNAPIRLEPPDVLAFYLPGASVEQGAGPSPVRSALAAAAVLDNLDAYLEAYFRQGTMSAMLVSVGQSISRSSQQEMQSFFRQALAGVRNAFRVQVLDTDVKVHPLGGQTPSALAVEELKRAAREDIAVALGVPPDMLMSNAANYATAQQSAITFYQTTVTKYCRLIQETLNRDLYRPQGVQMRFALERLEVFQAQEAQKATSLSTLMLAGVLTVNEVREVMGFEPLAIDAADDVATTADPAGVELRQWRSKATRRWKEGKAPAAVEFTAQHIPPALTASIAEQLATAASVDDVRQIFDDAERWRMYP